MLGKNHLIVNLTTTVAATFGLSAVAANNGTNIALRNLCIKSLSLFYSDSLSMNFPTSLDTVLFYTPLYMFVCFSMLIIGSLFPDVDSPSSMAGKYFYLPIKHRTWTHSFWFLILPTFLSSVSFPFRFFTLGYVLHLLFDAVSAAGICFWYPFEKYREYGNGAFVAPNHWLKIYHTGKMSECYLTVFILLMNVLICYISRSGILYFYSFYLV